MLVKQFEDLFSFIMFETDKISAHKRKSDDLFEREVKELKDFLDGFKPLKK